MTCYSYSRGRGDGAERLGPVAAAEGSASHGALDRSSCSEVNHPCLGVLAGDPG